MTWLVFFASQLALVAICRGYFEMTFWPTQVVLLLGGFVWFVWDLRQSLKAILGDAK